MPTPTTDFSIFDGQELVTYDPVGRSRSSANIPAVRRPLTQSRQRNVERYIELAADGRRVSPRWRAAGSRRTGRGRHDYGCRERRRTRCCSSSGRHSTTRWPSCAGRRRLSARSDVLSPWLRHGCPSPVARGRDAAIEHFDEFGEQLGFAAFQDDADLPPRSRLAFMASAAASTPASVSWPPVPKRL